jgi:hypothetical protein
MKKSGPVDCEDAANLAVRTGPHSIMHKNSGRLFHKGEDGRQNAPVRGISPSSPTSQAPFAAADRIP